MTSGLTAADEVLKWRDGHVSFNRFDSALYKNVTVLAIINGRWSSVAKASAPADSWLIAPASLLRWEN